MSNNQTDDIKVCEDGGFKDENIKKIKVNEAGIVLNLYEIKLIQPYTQL